MTEEYLSQRAFALLPEVGVSHVRINKLIREGRIPTDDKGKIPKLAGIEAWKTCRVIGYEKQAEAGAKYGGNPKAKKQNHTEDEAQSGSLGERLSKAKAEKAELDVKKLRHEVAVINREFIHVSEIEAEAQELAMKVKQKLISIAPIIAATAEGKTAAQIQRIVEIHINGALEDLQKIGV